VKTLVTSVLLAIALELPLAVFAEDSYQFEAELAYDRQKSDFIEIELAGASLNYYFAPLPLQPKDHPQDETAFVSRASGLSLLLARVTFDVNGYQTTSDGSAAGVELTFRRPDSPLYLRGHYLKIDYGKQSTTFGGFGPVTTIEVETEQDAYEVDVGGYVARTSLLALEIGEETFKARSNISGPAPDQKTQHIGVFGRHLVQGEAGEHVALEAHLLRLEADVPGSASQTGQRVDLQATIYPKRNFGLTIAFATENGDAATIDRGIRFGGKVFVTPAISAFLQYEQTDYQDGTESVDRTSIGVAMRF